MNLNFRQKKGAYAFACACACVFAMFSEDASRQGFSASLQLTSLLYHFKHEYTWNNAFCVRHISNT